MLKKLRQLVLPAFFLAGCGSDQVQNSVAGQPAPPAVSSPAISGLIDNGHQQFVETYIDAKAGGRLVLPNGAELIIPPGSLASSQTIRFAYDPTQVAPGGPQKLDDQGEDPSQDGDMYYTVTPSQKLLVPATLKLPYPLDVDWEYPDVAVTSPDNPVVDLGSETTQYEPLAPDYDEEGDRIVITTEHFSGFSLLTAGEPSYLVMDVPQPYLLPSDMLFCFSTQTGATAVGLGKGPGFVPGHAAVYTGQSAPFPSGTRLDTGGSNPQIRQGIPDSVEAVPDKVHAVTVDLFRTGFHNDHLYLGPRRPRKPRSPAQANSIAQEAPRALGKPYYVLGDGAAILSAFFNPADLVRHTVDPFSTNRGYSCVGLIDVLYLRAGLPLVGNIDRLILAVTPKDMMESTDPVRNVTLRVGQPFSMDIYGVIRKPEFSAVLARVPYSRNRREENDGVVNSYDIAISGLTGNASFQPNGDNNGYRLTWTPSQTGTFTFNLELQAEVFEKVIPILFIRPNKKLERGKNNPLRERLVFEVVP